MRKKIHSWKWMQFCLCCCMLLFSVTQVAAQQQSVKGKVIDAANGEPLIGVSIQEKGTTTGVITDIDGNFIINVPGNATLVFSYIGYKTLELSAQEAKGTVKMSEDSQNLQEVVVVGYGVQKKVNLSGSVSALDGEAIASKPASDVLTAMQGEMPGVTILRSGGEPGSETSGMRIRGFSSVNDASALVLIDGVEGDLTLLNPNDIASVSVLKDAASCAIYGARAAAGVVLVTTKNGTEGKPRVSYNGYYSFNTPGNMPERLPAWEEQDWINQSRLAANGAAEWNAEKSSWVGNPNFNTRPLSNGRWDFFQSTNWLEEGTKDVMGQQSHSVSVSGGTQKMNYMVSGNFYTKEGILKYGPDENDRYNLLAKFNADVNKYVTLGINVQYQSRERETSSYGGAVFSACCILRAVVSPSIIRRKMINFTTVTCRPTLSTS